MAYETRDATALASLVRRGEVSPLELLQAALERAEAWEALNALTLLSREAAERAIERGLPEGPLRGVPFLLKDLGAETRRWPSNLGSRVFANTTYSYDSTLVTRLDLAGLVTFGRTTAPEFGIGVATEAAVYGGPTLNPWNRDRTPGGSSGGAAAAVAAGIVPAAHGSDGGGSVRIPASCCGLFGFKPSRGLMPDGPEGGEGWGGMATDGFLTRSVRDGALLLDVSAGADGRAPYAPPALPGSFCEALAIPSTPLRIALCDTTLTGEPISGPCRDAARDVGRLLEAMGHHVEEARPDADVAAMMKAWVTIVACGTALVMEGRDESKLEPVARDAVRVGREVSGLRYLAAIETVHAFGRDMARFLERHDMLVTATLAEPPARIGRFDHGGEDYREFRERVFEYSPFCAAFNASGQPAASVPLHRHAGLPIGVHLAMGFGRDLELMRLCGELERAKPWADHLPVKRQT